MSRWCARYGGKSMSWLVPQSEVLRNQFQAKSPTCDGPIFLYEILTGLEVKCPDEFEMGFAGIASANAADAEEFFATALEVRFHGFDVRRRHDQDHADAQVEGLQQIFRADISDFGQVFEDGRHRPRR